MNKIGECGGYNIEDAPNAKYWHLVSPEGKEYKFHTLSSWLRENGEFFFGCKPDSKEFKAVTNGLIRAKRMKLGGGHGCCTYKGWKVIPTKDDYIKSNKKQQCKAKEQCRKIDAYKKYEGCNYDILTAREREILLLKISGMTYSEISHKLNVSESSIGVLLKKARDKLDGRETTYQKNYRNNKEKFQKWRDEHRESYLDSKKKYYEKHREELIKAMKEYNKKYYQENRERLLQKKRDKKKINLQNRLRNAREGGLATAPQQLNHITEDKKQYGAKHSLMKGNCMNNQQIIDLYNKGLSIREISHQLHISETKIKKIMVSEGCFENETMRNIQRLYNSGSSTQEISHVLGISKTCVNMYLPYKKGVYNSDTPSENAKRIRKCREKKN